MIYSQRISLAPTTSGAIGLCPFHDDQHPGFGVNTEGNYWHCFAGCGGCGFVETMRKLTKLLSLVKT
ncbi:MAG: hypothetical protein JXR84_11800 [Anaerolineae bacterium]|nr:hypothetical protein [Anaerolineae bacterium]